MDTAANMRTRFRLRGLPSRGGDGHAEPDKTFRKWSEGGAGREGARGLWLGCGGSLWEGQVWAEPALPALRRGHPGARGQMARQRASSRSRVNSNRGRGDQGPRGWDKVCRPHDGPCAGSSAGVTNDPDHLATG